MRWLSMAIDESPITQRRTKPKRIIFQDSYDSPHVQCETGVNHNNMSPHDAIQFQYAWAQASCIAISGNMMCLVRASRHFVVFVVFILKTYSCSFNTFDDSAANGLVLPMSIVVMSPVNTATGTYFDLRCRSTSSIVENQSTQSKSRGAAVSACSNHKGRKLEKLQVAFLLCAGLLNSACAMAYIRTIGSCENISNRLLCEMLSVRRWSRYSMSFSRNKRNWFFSSLPIFFCGVQKCVEFTFQAFASISFDWCREWSL